MSEQKRPYVDPEPLGPEAIKEAKDILKNEGWEGEGLVRFQKDDPSESPQDKQERWQQFIANVDKMRDIEAGETTVDLRTYIHLYAQEVASAEEVKIAEEEWMNNLSDESKRKKLFSVGQPGNGVLYFVLDSHYKYEFKLFFTSKDGSLKKVPLDASRISTFKVSVDAVNDAMRARMRSETPYSDSEDEKAAQNKLYDAIRSALLELNFNIPTRHQFKQENSLQYLHVSIMRQVEMLRLRRAKAEKETQGFEF